MVPKGGRRRGSILSLELLSSIDQKTIIFEELLARRDGSVLTRNTILKSDHFETINRAPGTKFLQDFELLGAPNFRQAHLNIFGVAQPTVPGLATILRLLQCGPTEDGTCTPEHACSWFSTREEPLVYIDDRPFVLRDHDNPFENIRSYAGISAARLNQMEERLRDDILQEIAMNNGLILVHNETEEHHIIPCLTAAKSVRTPAQIFADMQSAGFCVKYHRLPISHEQSPTDAYIDDCIKIFREMPTKNHAVIFSCGIGIGRTTYAMVIGMLIRRSSMINEGGLDPLVDRLKGKDSTSQSILRLVYILERSLTKQASIEWKLARGGIIERLCEAIDGNYQVITDLTRVLQHGSLRKGIVDRAIDRCEALLNIREEILFNRVRHDTEQNSAALDTGLSFLERYFSLIAFCAYMDDEKAKDTTFRSWMREHREIWNMFQNLRKSTNKLKAFRPVEDLSALWNPHTKQQLPPASPYIGPDEMVGHNVIKNRSGSVLSPHTILKIDHWSREKNLFSEILGAPNFRRFGKRNIYATAQPTLQALKHILSLISSQLGPGEQICWINVREEPLVYIAGEPYVLRDLYATLRNIKSYAGITVDRLEEMELRLKDDIVNEASLYNNRILVHSESSDEKISPSWIPIDDEADVWTLAEVFNDLRREFPFLIYKRLPMTSEEAPEAEQFDAILNQLLCFVPNGAYVVFNCQMGVTRSTTSAVIAAQILTWLGQEINGTSDVDCPPSDPRPEVHYKIIHSLIRMLKHSFECKRATDELIKEAASVVDLREAIDVQRKIYETSLDPLEQRKSLRKGIVCLKRYFLLILFQSYLRETPPLIRVGDIESFQSWLARHLEFKGLIHDLEHKPGLEVLEASDLMKPSEGIALATDVQTVVRDRYGSVLASMTILKFDHFPGCQKMSLPERIEGVPNFRKVVLGNDIAVYGLAMPTKAGIKRILRRLDENSLWVCLREEPVIYVNGKPYVLRVVEDPVANLEMTGIISERVEFMEDRLKKDVLNELSQFGGKLLLHEEDASTGAIVPVWEQVNPKDVETTLEIMKSINDEGNRLHYVRIPVTDEQAPIPEVFENLYRLICSSSGARTRYIFNCQMGRGRTSTGMIITVLIHLVHNLNDDPVGKVSTGELTEDFSSWNLTDGIDKSRQYLDGQYKLILQLIQVLDHGKEAKRLLDKAIDMCDHIQNLREAIYDYKLKAISPSESPALWDRGLNYLMRYFFLIVFAEYLLGKPKDDYTFVQWLNDRREILNVVSRRDQVDFS